MPLWRSRIALPPGDTQAVLEREKGAPSLQGPRYEGREKQSTWNKAFEPARGLQSHAHTLLRDLASGAAAVRNPCRSSSSFLAARRRNTPRLSPSRDSGCDLLPNSTASLRGAASSLPTLRAMRLMAAQSSALCGLAGGAAAAHPGPALAAEGAAQRPSQGALCASPVQRKSGTRARSASAALPSSGASARHTLDSQGLRTVPSLHTGPGRPGALGRTPCQAPRRQQRRVGSTRAVLREVATELPPSADVASPELGSLLRGDFPILDEVLQSGLPLVYLDSAATSQKPRQVLQAMDNYYAHLNANVHRGVHTLSALATEAYEAGRDKVQSLVNAAHREEIIFTRNATEAINLVAHTWGTANLKPGDEIVLTVAEHHSNLVPWQLLAQRTGAVLKFAELRSHGGAEGGEEAGGAGGEEVNVEQLLELITPRTRLVATHHVSNVLGSEMPVGLIGARAREVGARFLLDACQSVPHMAVDVQQLGADFVVASSHKMLGPTGVGFLYAPLDLLRSMPPFLGGGEMIQDVFLQESTYAEPPARFEAGTPAIAESVGLGAAIDYMRNVVPGSLPAIHRYEMELTSYLYSKLTAIPGVHVYGPPPPTPGSTGGSLRTHRAAALCAFNVQGIHPTDLSTFLDEQHGIAIRSGHHCAQPLHRTLGVSSSARVSLHCYNTRAEVDTFIAALNDTRDFFLGMPQ